MPPKMLAKPREMKAVLVCHELRSMELMIFEVRVGEGSGRSVSEVLF